MRRVLRVGLLGLVVALAQLALVACQPKVVAPPPECANDVDCGAYKRCEAGRCLVLNTPEERAASQLRVAENLLKAGKPDYNAVLAAYQAVQAEIPTVEGIELNIGLCYLKMGDEEHAAAIFKKLREATPDDANVLLASGLLLSSHGKNKEALDLYQGFLKTHPDNLEVLTNVATLFRAEKKYDDALAVTRKILIKDPAHPGAFNNLGLIFFEQNKLLLSRMVTTSGIKAQEDVKKRPDAGLYNNLALIHSQMGNDDQAVANWRIANQIDPTLVGPNLNLAHKALVYADFERARKHYEAALAQDPNNREALIGVAQCYAPLKKHEEALAIYQKLVAGNPKDAVAWFDLGVLYFDHLKKQQESRDAFNKFLTLGYDDKAKVAQAKEYLTKEIVVATPPEAPKPEGAQAPIDNDIPVVPESAEGAAPAAGSDAVPAPAPDALPAPAPDAAPAPAPVAPAPAPTGAEGDTPAPVPAN